MIVGCPYLLSPSRMLIWKRLSVYLPGSGPAHGRETLYFQSPALVMTIEIKTNNKQPMSDRLIKLDQHSSSLLRGRGLFTFDRLERGSR